MSINNPDILLPLLDDLIDHLQKWSYRTSDTMNESDRMQLLATNMLEEYKHKVAVVKNQSEEDLLLAERTELEVVGLVQKSQSELQSATILLAQSTVTLSKATSTKQHWESELMKARVWLETAKAELRSAILELSNAEQELQVAKNELYYAERALQDCQNSYVVDKNGNKRRRDCSGYASAVSSARTRVNRARNWVSQAQTQKNYAEAEVARARARVNFCTDKLAYAEKAVKDAALACDFAKQSLSFAERSCEEAQAAKASQERAMEKAIQQKELVEEMLAKLLVAISEHGDAHYKQRDAESYANTAQNLLRNGVQELDIRLDFLRKFAQVPTFIKPSSPPKT